MYNPEDIPWWVVWTLAGSSILVGSFLQSIVPGKWQPLLAYIGIFMGALALSFIFGKLPFGQELHRKGVPLLLIPISTSVLIFSIFWYLFYIPKISTALIIAPKIYEPFIHFKNAELSPSKDNPDPFKLEINNREEATINDLKIKFEIPGLDLQKLINSSSAAFPIVEPKLQDGVFITTRKGGDGNDKQYVELNFSTTGEIVIISLSPHMPISFDMPQEISKAISLFMIARASEFGFGMSQDMSHKIYETYKNGVDKNKSSDLTNELWKEHRIEIPNIVLHATWSSENQEVMQTITFRSVYKAFGGVYWATEKDTGDQLLAASMGILSFENPSTPGKGIYNQWRIDSNGNR
jgi:hypothetical protein